MPEQDLPRCGVSNSLISDDTKQTTIIICITDKNDLFHPNRDDLEVGLYS